MSPYGHDTITPYKSEDAKKNQVRTMFDGIAPRYDFLNHFLSLGIDILWRRIALNKIKDGEHKSILDIATGTGDLAIEAARKFNAEQIVGIDISDKMIALAEKKILARKLNHVISVEQGDSERLKFDSNKFDTVMSSFGVRNFENLEAGLTEMHRVLKSGGVVMILEFSSPRIFPIKQLYAIYAKYLLPLVGKLVSKDNDAYSYLYKSSSTFPCFEDFNAVLDKIGFRESRYYPLSFGICCVYIAKK